MRVPKDRHNMSEDPESCTTLKKQKKNNGKSLFSTITTGYQDVNVTSTDAGECVHGCMEPVYVPGSIKTPT